MGKDYIKKEIMEQSRHLFIYGYDGDERRDFLKSLKEDYKPGIATNTPVAVYLEECGLPRIPVDKNRDINRINSIAREHLEFNIAHTILEDAAKSLSTQELNERLKRMLSTLNRYGKNNGYKDIENIEELIELLKKSKEFYKKYFEGYVISGKEENIDSIALPFLQLELWIRQYKSALQMDSHFGIIVDKQEPIAISSMKNINFLVGARINGDISMKVATTPDGWDTYYDPNGQLAEYIHDYGTVEFDDSMKQYMKKIRPSYEDDE